MKKLFVTLLFAAFSFSSLFAQHKDERIVLNFTATPSVNTLMMKGSDIMHSKMCLGGNLGTEIQWNPFRDASNTYLSLGFQFSSFGGRAVIDGSDVHKFNEYGVGHYTLTTNFSNLQEQIRLYSLGIPVGVYFKGDLLHFGFGLEFSALLNATSQLKQGTIVTDFHSDDYNMDISHDAGIHGIKTYEVNDSPKQSLDIKRASLMPFVDVAIPMDNVSVGFFVGYGLSNQYKKDEYSEKPLVTIGDEQQYHSVAHSDQINRMNKLMVGLRLRVSLERVFTTITKTGGKSGGDGRRIDPNKDDPNADKPEKPAEEATNCKKKVDDLNARIARLLGGKYNKDEADKIRKDYNDLSNKCSKDAKSVKVNELEEYGKVYQEFYGYVTKALEKGNDRAYRSNAIIDFCDDVKKSAYWNRNSGSRFKYIDDKIEKLLDEAEAIRGAKKSEDRNTHWNQFKQIAESF